MNEVIDLSQTQEQSVDPITLERLQNRRSQLIEKLEHATANEDFRLMYQAQSHTEKTATIGIEALIRWVAPGFGKVPPSEFIPIAEQTGLILPIGRWVIKQACIDMARLNAIHDSNSYVALNISKKQLLSDDLITQISTSLKDNNVDARQLHVEIDELSVLRHPGRVAKTIKALDNLGVQVWIDDFGRGYSSLGMLHRLPISGITIAGNLVRRVNKSKSDHALVAAVIAMANCLNKKIVAKGVETQAQLDTIKEMGCRRVQGFLLCPPRTIESVAISW